MSTRFFLILCSLALIPLSTVMAADGKEILQKQCVQCHAIDSDGPKTLKELWEQKGPNLSFSGNKYKQSWLEKWLNQPKRIWPAGLFYGNHIKPGKERDQLDPATLKPHMKLSKKESKAVAAALMTLKRKSHLFKAKAYKSGSISASMGDLLFVKIRGCSSCHQIEPGYGGISGPEVYTAANRLQEDYIVSFLKNPQAWSPLNFMPSYRLKDRDIQKFVHYFRALAKENK